MRPAAPGSTIDASVVICTHNPRADYLARVLEGLRNQTLPKDRWELLIVDNSSQPPLCDHCDVSWHPAARHILETKVGLSWARQRGIKEALGDLIIFVDDDNVLDQSYLVEAIQIKTDWPFLGVWGSGSIQGDLEIELPDSLRKHESWLPVRHLATPCWGSLPFHDDVIPIGAGLCVRKEVAFSYVRSCNQSPVKIIGRQGNSLTGHEEVEISFVCCRDGLGMGVFPQLKMAHLIPKQRLSEEYFIRFVEGTCTSEFVLQLQSGGKLFRTLL